MFNTGTSKSRRPAFHVTSRQSKVLVISLVSVLLCCLLFYVSEYRVKWSGRKKNRTGEHFINVGRTVTEANCKAITNGDEFELKKADLLHNVSRTAKSDESIYSALQGVASCFENVHVLATRVDVQWGFFSVLEPELICMEHLWNRSAAWRYFINLTGQEFPLRTNYELVRILQAYKGANDVEGTVKRYSQFVF